MSDKAERKVQEFPGPLSLAPSIWKRVYQLVIASSLTIGGVGLAFSSHDRFERTVEISAIVLFGLGILVVLAALLPGAFSLTLKAESFTVTRFFRTLTFNWNDVSEFSVGYGPKIRRPDSVRFTVRKRNYFLPDVFDKPSDLCSLLNNWRNVANEEKRGPLK
jgi:hypothetical protein